MDENREMIEKIIGIEWDMFVSVNDGEEPASCQEDRVTFEGMRKAQFSAWSPDTAASYLDDLESAQQGGRNLVEEKYIHMMKTTEPIRYESLLPRVKMPSSTANALAQEVSDIMLEQTRLLFEYYPYVSGHGRPLYSALDYGGISVETYQLGELLTYSEKTLAALKEHALALKEAGKSLAREILENTVKFYGYESLDAAEMATRERIDARGIEISFGCACDDGCDY